jgi:hypothetical protein
VDEADKAADRVALEDQAAHKAVRVVLAVNEAVAKLVAADKVAVRAVLAVSGAEVKLVVADKEAVRVVLVVLVVPADRAGLTLRMTQRSKKS